MDPITFPMFMGTKNPRTFVPGEEVEGGFFVGYISHTLNGVPTHALIVAPAASGYNTSGLAWRAPYYTYPTPGTESLFDGAVNTAAMIAADIADPVYSNHPAAQYCANLTIDGYSDWYLPAYYELEIAYYNLKPAGITNALTGINRNYYAVPQRPTGYTTRLPMQTLVEDFKEGGPEAFRQISHWTSCTDDNRDERATYMSFTDGFTVERNKDSKYSVRAFRKFAV